ncbi:MAG: RNA polymerase factor sigma-54 [Verrucomicrobia bacterium]|nr:MAG: RNA polymerase factor sigma-54 [Verrucomicrobiota bacterium]
MQLSAGLSQQQFLSVQMQQGLELLQAPAMELRGLIAAELVANPVLEEEFFLEPTVSEKNETAASNEELSWRESEARGNQDEQRQRFLESRPSNTTLAETIEAQTASFLAEDQPIIQAIAGNLDAWGYLRVSCAEIAVSLSLSEQHVEEVLEKIQLLDPPGVAARDLKECLLIQLRHQGRENGLASRIVSHYLPQLARHHYEEIAKNLRLPLSEVLKEVAIITALEPHPGRPYIKSEEQTVIPDLIVMEEEGVFLVRFNEEGQPRMKISDYYKEMLSSQSENQELRHYLQEKIRLGKSFIHHVEQRQSTLMAVGRDIVRRQEDFFKYGTYGLHPMTMAQVAQTLGVHVTTISRAVAGKTMDTPRGLYSLKYFFTAGIEQENGAHVSNEMVKSSLKKMIQEEQKQKPWSDQKIVARFQELGIHIARRTIAHYREQLGILPAHLRKK